MESNREYKNSLFVSLFSDEKRLLELYNAIENKEFNMDSKIEINTLENVLFFGCANDVSFIIDNKLVVLVEDQSTINNNMPLRCLEYISRIYDNIVDNKAMYRKKLLKIPRPEFIVLYNGIDKCPDYQELKLSDAFLEPGRIELELVVKVYNVNPGHNDEIRKKSKTLDAYIFFINRVLVNNSKKGMSLTEAITEAIRYCINNGIMKEYLEKHGSEVVSMLYTEFRLEDALEVAKEEGREEGLEKGREKGLEEGLEKGREEGLEKGREEGILEVVKNALIMNMPIEDIAKLTRLSRYTVEKLKAQITGL